MVLGLLCNGNGSIDDNDEGRSIKIWLIDFDFIDEIGLLSCFDDSFHFGYAVLAKGDLNTAVYVR